MSKKIFSRKQKEKLLQNEIVRSLLLSDEEKGFWLRQIKTLPQINLDRILGQIQGKNKIVDKFLVVALRNDSRHTYLSELKSLLTKLKKDGFKVEEEQQNQNAEAFLEDNLSNF